MCHAGAETKYKIQDSSLLDFYTRAVKDLTNLFEAA